MKGTERSAVDSTGTEWLFPLPPQHLMSAVAGLERREGQRR